MSEINAKVRLQFHYVFDSCLDLTALSRSHKGMQKMPALPPPKGHQLHLHFYTHTGYPENIHGTFKNDDDIE